MARKVWICMTHTRNAMDMSVVGDLFANILPWLRLWRRHQQTVGLLASGCLRLCLRLLRIVLQGTAL